MLLDKDILDYVAPDGKLIPQRCSKSVLERHGFYEYVINRYKDNTLDKNDKNYLRECLYRMVNNIEVPPVCKVCGKSLKFSYQRYPVYCSQSCLNKDDEVLKKISSSCSQSLKNAYVENGDEIKKKRAETLSKIYGVETKSSSPFSIQEIQDISKERIFEKYGVKNVFQLESSRRKNVDIQRQKSIRMQKERGIDIEYTNQDTYLVRNCCPIHGDLEFTQTEFNNRFRLSRYRVSNPCYICNPFGNQFSGMEKTLTDYIKSIYSGTVIENDKTVLNGLEIDIYLPDLKVGFEFNGDYWHMNPLFHRFDDMNPSSHILAVDKWKDDRHKMIVADEKGIKLYRIWEYSFVNEREYVDDFVMNVIRGNIEYENPLIKLKNILDKINPDYKLIDDMIFEYEQVRIVYLDGFYCGKDTISKDYLVSLLSRDRRTIFVYDYEITDERKFDVIVSDIRYALNMIDRRIYARKCELKELSNKDVRDFLVENSLFGYRTASITFGLFYENELVMVYSFGNNYYGRNGDTEIIRVCTKKNTQVIGGSSKCLKQYIDKYGNDGDALIFYVDAIHHNGNSMNKDGFEFIRHEYGLMNYYITHERYGETFNRSPGRNDEVKELLKKNEIICVLTNGVDVYKKIIRK